MEKKVVRVCIIFMFILIFHNVISVKGADSKTAKRMNVVFVMDESGSMSDTDINALRYEAVDLFLGLVTDFGNYMGAVVFDDNIVLQRDIAALEGNDAKNELSKSIREAYSNGDTDIGKAIELATDMLLKSGNSELESVIILLSDGNTDLPKDKTGEARIQSENSKQIAINNALNNGYKIHSICLNANGKANSDELKAISDATSGVCVEVKSAEDLKEVFSQFYSIIYDTETITLSDSLLPEQGVLEIPFYIPVIGVEEANIIINTLNPNTTYTLYKPNDVAMTTQELDTVKITAKTFSIIKLPNPDAGQWKLEIKGIPGDQVKIDMIYNSDLTLGADINYGNEECSLNDKVSISAQLYNKGNIVSGKAVYEDYPAIAYITNTLTGEMQMLILEAQDDRGQAYFEVKEYADYDIQIKNTIDNINVSSGVYHLTVGNSSPKCKEENIEISKLISPFTKQDYIVKLDEFITDKEDAQLDYAIVSSDFGSTLVFVDQSEMYIKIKECGNGGLVIKAMDSRGASTEVQVTIKTTSLTLILLGVFIPIILIIIIIIGAKKIKDGNKCINGKIQIMPYNEDSILASPQVYEGTKGKMMLSRYLHVKEDIGVKLGTTYLKAGEKESYIYLISKEGYYSDCNLEKREKKIRLDSDMEISISSDDDLSKGIKVTYMQDIIWF